MITTQDGGYLIPRQPTTTAGGVVRWSSVQVYEEQTLQKQDPTIIIRALRQTRCGMVTVV